MYIGCCVRIFFYGPTECRVEDRGKDDRGIWLFVGAVRVIGARDSILACRLKADTDYRKGQRYYIREMMEQVRYPVEINRRLSSSAANDCSFCFDLFSVCLFDCVFSSFLLLFVPFVSSSSPGCPPKAIVSHRSLYFHFPICLPS